MKWSRSTHILRLWSQLWSSNYKLRWLQADFQLLLPATCHSIYLTYWNSGDFPLGLGKPVSIKRWNLYSKIKDLKVFSVTDLEHKPKTNAKPWPISCPWPHPRTSHVQVTKNWYSCLKCKCHSEWAKFCIVLLQYFLKKTKIYYFSSPFSGIKWWHNTMSFLTTSCPNAELCFHIYQNKVKIVFAVREFVGERCAQKS